MRKQVELRMSQNGTEARLWQSIPCHNEWVRQEKLYQRLWINPPPLGVPTVTRCDERSYAVDCGITRHSIHSECPYSNVHFWQRICAKLRGQRGVKLSLTVPNR